MARASTPTLLPLDVFFKIIGLHPLHANQVTLDEAAPTKTCGLPILQYNWQDADRVAREDMALAIAHAEAEISRHLGFKPLPTWEVDERVYFTRPVDPLLYNATGLNARGQWASVRTSHGELISGGLEAKSLIDDAVAVVYSDDDGDGYDETATITVTTTVTDANQIAVYYPGESGDDEWEIRPLKRVTISGGVATIKCRREQLVLPDLMERLDPTNVEGTTDADFLTTVDVYRHYLDPSQQIQFLWERQPNTCGCGSGDCDQCAMETQFGCTNVRNQRLGIISGAPAIWNSTTEEYESDNWAADRQPDRARLWYYAGWRDKRQRRPNVDMDLRWAMAISYYALTLMDRPICGCENIEHVVRRWRDDMAENPADGGGFQLSEKVLNNPLGTTRGAIHAWRLIRQERVLQ